MAGGAAPACTVGTYAQGVLRLGTNRFILGQAGDVVAIGRWSCGQATLALLRPGLVSQLYVFPAWPQAAGAQESASLVASVPGGQTLTPVAEGGCDVLAVGRRDGTSVDVGPFEVGGSP